MNERERVAFALVYLPAHADGSLMSFDGNEGMGTHTLLPDALDEFL